MEDVRRGRGERQDGARLEIRVCNCTECSRLVARGQWLITVPDFAPRVVGPGKDAKKLRSAHRARRGGVVGLHGADCGEDLPRDAVLAACGAAALLAAQGRTDDNIMTALEATARHPGTGDRGVFDPVYGYGIVDAEERAAR